jgi:predicted amidohydrolase YtcJ
MTQSNSRTLLFGGPIITQNEKRETHDALVLEGDVIVATGALDDMRRLAGSSAREVDLEGASAIPGLIDSHPHFLHYGSFDASCVKLYDARDHADIKERIRARAAVTPRGEWIITTPVGEPHYFTRRSWRDLPEGRLPNRHELDEVAPDHPVWIQAYAPRIPNVCAMNSRALQLLEFTRDLPDRVSDVWIEKDQHGEPTGIFTGSVTNYYNPDTFWLTRVTSQVLRPHDDFWYNGALGGQITAAKSGVTAAFEGHVMDPEHIAAYQRARDEGRLRMRVLAAPSIASYALDIGLGLTDDIIRANMPKANRLRQTTDELFRVNGMTLDRAAYCFPGMIRIGRPYKDPFGRETMGRTFVSQELQKEVIAFALENDVWLNMVHVGYPDHKEFLEALEPFLGKWDIRGREWVTQHNLLIDDATIARYVDLKFHFTSTASFCWGKGDVYIERMGEDIVKDFVPIGKMFDSGANVGLGSDWGPASPFEHMALLETRELAGSGRRLAGPGFSIGRQQAFDGWTINNARLMQWDKIGALKPGYKADITIVDRNPLTCGIGELPKTQVLKTVLGGADIFDTGILRRFDDADLPAERVQSLGKASSLGGSQPHVCGAQCNHVGN